MGSASFKVPPQVESMPKNSKDVTFKVEYCGSWGGRPEADYVAQLLKIVYPNAKVEVFTPGHTANLIVQVNGKEFYNRKTRSDEKVREETAVKFLEKVAGAVANEKWARLWKWFRAKMKVEWRLQGKLLSLYAWLMICFFVILLI